MLRGSLLPQSSEHGQWPNSGEQTPPQSWIGGRVVDAAATGAAPALLWLLLLLLLVCRRGSCRDGGGCGRYLLHIRHLLGVARVVVDADAIADVRRAGHVRYGGKELAVSRFLVCLFDVVGWVIGW